jgi:hypothetical protein
MPRALAISVVLLLLGTASSQAAEDESLKSILKRIGDDARQMRKKFGVYPTVDPAFPFKHPTIEAPQVIEALGQRLDPDPSIDGYLKLQLMACGPDLFNTPSEKLLRMVIHMPALITYRPPVRPRLLVAAETTVFPLRVVRRQLKPIIRHFNESIRRTADANRSSRAFARMLCTRVPHQGGLRLLAMLHEARDQYKAGAWIAGSRRYTRTRQIAKEARMMWDLREQMPGLVRRQMRYLLEQMHTSQPPKGGRGPIQAIHLGKDGRLKIVRRPRCFPLNDKLYKDLIRYVSGPRK